MRMCWSRLSEQCYLANLHVYHFHEQMEVLSGELTHPRTFLSLIRFSVLLRVGSAIVVLLLCHLSQRKALNQNISAALGPLICLHHHWETYTKKINPTSMIFLKWDTQPPLQLLSVSLPKAQLCRKRKQPPI